MTQKRTITLGHSPDADDAFMFYAMAKGKIDTGELEFQHILQDIETLNQRAMKGELDVTAVSVHAYSKVCARYALLPCGASFGDGYGPLVIAREAMNPQELADIKIAVPGRMTSAYLALCLAIGEFSYEEVPFDQILPRVAEGEFAAGLLIHEGQLTYADEGLQSVLDLGVWWAEETDGLPLPLGANAILKDLGDDLIPRINNYIKQSIEFGLAHREEALRHAMKYGRDLDQSRADRFVGMYVNDLTLDYGERGRKAVSLFLDRAHEEGLIPNRVEIEFIS